jgi:hypothetical protein
MPLLASTGWPEELLEDPDLLAFDRPGGLTPDPEDARVARGIVELVEELLRGAVRKASYLPGEYSPAQPPVEASRSGRLVVFGNVDDDPVAARKPQPGDRVEQEPGPDPVSAPRFLDSQLPEVGPVTQSGKCSAVGEV